MLFRNEHGSLQFSLASVFYASSILVIGCVWTMKTIPFSLLIIVVCLFSKRQTVPLVYLIFAAFLTWSTIEYRTSNSQILRGKENRLEFENIRKVSEACVYHSLSQTSSQKNKFRNSESPELRHSWRVYILPYLGYQSLFDKYDFNEPWNGANNCKLQAEMPREYECALQPETGKTPFKMVSERSDQNNFYSETCHDGATQTVAMIEDRYNQINWMSLNDIDRDAATNLLNQNDSRFVTADESLFFDRYRGIKFSLASCKIIARPRILPHPVPQAIFTRDGGENCTEVISTFVTAYS